MAVAPKKKMRLADIGRALRHKNYRLFFFGQGVSLIGTWVTRVATSWLVYRLTGSALLLGLVGFAGQLPTFLLSPFAGVLVDRVDRHRVLVITQVLAMIQSTLLFAFAFTNTITAWHVLVLSGFQGIINAFDTPARQAFVSEMVESREDLPNAIALNSSMVNGARLVGPSVAGILIAGFGEAWCFGIDAASYVAVLASLLLMRVPERARPTSQVRFRKELEEGLRYIAGFTPIRDILLLLAVVSLTGMPYAVLMPVFANEVLKGGPHTLGILMAATGVGALGGAVWLASRQSVLGLGKVIVVAGSIFGASLIVFSLSRWVWLSVPVLVFVGGGMMLQMAASNTMLQTLVDEHMRGRVMSFFTVAVLGMAPFGSLAAGWLGARFGAPAAVSLGGLVTLVCVAIFQRRLPEMRRRIRPLYVRLGILPEVAEGLDQAAEAGPHSVR